MTSYATLQGVKTQLVNDVTADDTVLANLLEQAAVLVDNRCGRVFNEVVATYDLTVKANSRSLYFDTRDLLSITTLTNADSTTISSGSYTLYPRNQYPKQRLDLDAGTVWLPATDTLIAEDPEGLYPCGYAISDNGGDGYSGYGRDRYFIDAVQIAGKWGYHQDYANAWKNSGKTGTVADTTTTTLTLNSAGTTIDIGHVVRMDAEQMLVIGPVAATSAATSLTVVRGYNGTTAAAHTAGTAIYTWEPEPTVEKATEMLVCGLYMGRNNPTGERQVVEGIGAISIPADIYKKVLTMLYPYENKLTRRV